MDAASLAALVSKMQDHVKEMATALKNVVKDNLSTDNTPADVELNRALLVVDNIAGDLEQLVFQVEDALRGGGVGNHVCHDTNVEAEASCSKDVDDDDVIPADWSPDDILDSMEYAPFLRGDDNGIPWADVVHPTQEDIFGTQPHVAEEQQPEGPGEVPAVGGCGCSYTMQEDLHLVKAWLNVSMDLVVGTNQSIRAFWQRIETFFHEHKHFHSTYNKKSLQGRLQRHVRCSNPWKRRSSRCYWVELRHHPKWQSEASLKKQKTSDVGSLASTQHVESCPRVNEPDGAAVGPSSGGPRPKWPPGRNHSKEVARGSSSSNLAFGPMIEIFDRQIAMKEKVEKERAERFAEMMRIEQQRLRLEEERVQLEKVKEEREKVKEEREIMNMDLSQMDEDQQAYYKILRQSIIAACRATSGPSN
ncbi:uncharacterized protein LOC133900239 [Phragmites australis]|uniref:uncharacterized protein LOC133900239 n=1 Tax=Phragmites australis TaxID=29695 RepID=UPI002D77A267|nr:uncharacterized protein LOC133900239 [Phragmites australis]